MNRELKEDLQKYLQAKETPTTTEQDMLSRLNGEMQNFVIAFLDRAALKRHGYEVNAVTDSNMEEIAVRMGDNYCNSRFSDDLCEACEMFGLTKAD